MLRLCSASPVAATTRRLILRSKSTTNIALDRLLSSSSSSSLSSSSSSSSSTPRNEGRKYSNNNHSNSLLGADSITKRTASSLEDPTKRLKSSVAAAEWDDDEEDTSRLQEQFKISQEIQRIKHLRNVGIMAHVDAGKTTVTERMLALAGVVRTAGCVDDGSTVTDYLPAERERGITIQSAAISFDWDWHNQKRGDDYEANDKVRIQLIDTPGHVDFSVEVNRSVAVLDGAVLVVDSVAGVQAQTETVWRAMTQPSWNNHVQPSDDSLPEKQDHAHEPLPCLAVINKMDKEGCNYGNAIESLRRRLAGANPIPIQIPIFRNGNIDSGRQRSKASYVTSDGKLSSNLVAISPENTVNTTGVFVGVVDLIHLRAIIWPDNTSSNVSDVTHCVPQVVNLVHPGSHIPIHPDCQVTKEAQQARRRFIEALAEVDPATEDYFLNDEEPSNAELRAGLRRATLERKALPVMAAAALKGKGIETIMDAVADLLPSPLDRMPPALTKLESRMEDRKRRKGNQKRKIEDTAGPGDDITSEQEQALQKKITIGHPLHPCVLALAFKVVHMKGRGGGDGRVVFARVYSGTLRDRDAIRVITPPAPGELPSEPQTERIGGMLELAGGRFNNVEGRECKSGDVCALVGLKNVVTGDTIMVASDVTSTSTTSHKKAKRNGKAKAELVCLAGVAAPKPVLTVRLEAETLEEQRCLSEALKLMSIEDPSLVIEDTESGTLLSGLGELHIEVTLDRLYREYGLEISSGPPAVTYRETITETIESPGGLVNYDRTIGGTRLQGAVHLVLKPNLCQRSIETGSSCMLLSDPVINVGPAVLEYLGLSDEATQEELMRRCEVYKGLVEGCQGALKRGPLKSCAMANVQCYVEAIDAEGGRASLAALPGSIRAAAANAVFTTLREGQGQCTVLEPTMSVEVTLPGETVGTVLSDLTTRRGTVGDVVVGDNKDQSLYAKALVRGDVPLVEILGYANSLRSLTGGEGAFTAEYKGHSPC